MWLRWRQEESWGTAQSQQNLSSGICTPTTATTVLWLLWLLMRVHTVLSLEQELNKLVKHFITSFRFALLCSSVQFPSYSYPPILSISSQESPLPEHGNGIICKCKRVFSFQFRKKGSTIFTCRNHNNPQSQGPYHLQVQGVYTHHSSRPFHWWSPGVGKWIRYKEMTVQLCTLYLIISIIPLQCLVDHCGVWVQLYLIHGLSYSPGAHWQGRTGMVWSGVTLSVSLRSLLEGLGSFKMEIHASQCSLCILIIPTN